MFFLYILGSHIPVIFPQIILLNKSEMYVANLMQRFVSAKRLFRNL